MNRNYILLHVTEALDEIQGILRKLKDEPDYNEPEFRVAMEHAFHHLNIAWNARNITREQIFECTADDLCNWGQFPKDLTFPA